MILQQQGFLHVSQGSCSSIASTVHVLAMNVDRKFRTCGHLLRNEPSNVEWMHKFPLALEKVKEIGWYV